MSFMNNGRLLAKTRKIIAIMIISTIIVTIVLIAITTRKQPSEPITNCMTCTHYSTEGTKCSNFSVYTCKEYLDTIGIEGTRCNPIPTC